MNRDEIQNEIKRRRLMLGNRKKSAIAAIEEGNYAVAIMALTEAAQHDAVISEYEFRLEEMEVNGE